MSLLNYRVAGRSAATAATANHCYANLWNASAVKSIFVTEIKHVKTVGTVDNQSLQRSTTIGTAGSTVTPDADNSDAGHISPQSTVTLGLGTFSVQPTLATPLLERFNLPATVGAGVIWTFPDGIRVGPGTGLAIATPEAVVGQPADITFVWRE